MHSLKLMLAATLMHLQGLSRRRVNALVMVVSVAGVIDENADLTPLSRLADRPVRVNLRGVRRINSYGVRGQRLAVLTHAAAIDRRGRHLLTVLEEALGE